MTTTVTWAHIKRGRTTFLKLDDLAEQVIRLFTNIEVPKLLHPAFATWPLSPCVGLVTRTRDPDLPPRPRGA